MISESRIFTIHDITHRQQEFNSYTGMMIIHKTADIMRIADRLALSYHPDDMATAKKLVGAGIIPTRANAWLMEYVEASDPPQHLASHDDVGEFTTESFPDINLSYPYGSTVDDVESINKIIKDISAPGILVKDYTNAAKHRMNAIIRDEIIISIVTDKSIEDIEFAVLPSPRLIYRLFHLAYRYDNIDAADHLYNMMCDYPCDEVTEELVKKLLKVMERVF